MPKQVETKMKLQGKSSQQRVVVEHVTVAAGGQAIVGTVIPGGGGDGDGVWMNPMNRGAAG